MTTVVISNTRIAQVVNGYKTKDVVPTNRYKCRGILALEQVEDFESLGVTAIGRSNDIFAKTGQRTRSSE